MQSTLIRRSNYGMTRDGVAGVHPWRQAVGYETFRSKYGPQYKVPFHMRGINARSAIRLGTLGGGLAVTAGIFAIFFFDGVPRVQKDILQKIPFIGEFFVHEVPPEDNPF